MHKSAGIPTPRRTFLTVLNVHKILFSQKVRNYSKFHILDKSKNRDNRFLVPDLDLEIFFAHFESLIDRKKNISIWKLWKKIIYLLKFER